MSNWIYRIGLSETEVQEEALKKLGFPYTKVVVEEALRAHIPETLDKPYKFQTSMREDAPNFFSCSSLISYLYTFAGVWMPSLTIEKYAYFKPITKEELQFGDVVFSHNDKDRARPDHLGLYLGDGNNLQAAGYWYKGKVLIEKLAESPSFADIVGYARVVDDIKEKRFVINIPDNRSDLRNKDDLLKEISKYN
jgi:hypothetical protein